MNNVPAQQAGLAVRASDAEREETVALLQRGFADGRLTRGELEERAGAAYAARTRARLRDLTADLPDAGQQPPRQAMIVDTRLLIILLCVCPPAGAAYWLLSLPAISGPLHRTRVFVRRAFRCAARSARWRNTAGPIMATAAGDKYGGTMARTDTATRLVAAPPERVFAALVDRAALTAWLPPDGMHGSFERFDARPGGSYRMILAYDDASTAHGKTTADSDIVEARFTEIVPGMRVVQAVDFVSDDPANAGTMTMTWEVTAVEAGTRVDVRADDVPDGISAEDHAGLNSTLAKLAAYLEE
jgi:uncharacterized protein YndB with AHSA1/START domain